MWKRADEHEVSRFDNTIVGDWTDGCERAPKNKRNVDTIFPQLPLMSCDLLPTLVLSLKVTRQKSQQVHRENSETYCYMLQYGIAKLALAAFAAAGRPLAARCTRTPRCSWRQIEAWHCCSCRRPLTLRTRSSHTLSHIFGTTEG